ncbi:MAG: autotransporter assembly complex family protein [Candidatus Endonucleobacter sp. (ex Gigantidas childressi)]|nr:autotransporter assembly complex family protein [Candidatus Endonucleobacter sp. (ex Gigantidas childressi)]
MKTLNGKVIFWLVKAIAKPEISSCVWSFPVVFLCFIISIPVLAASLQWRIEGVGGDLKENISIYLDALPIVDRLQLPVFKTRILKEVRHSLQAMGYYEPVITVHLPDPNTEVCIIAIVTGQPVIIRNVDILLQGDAVEDSAFSDLINILPLKKGAPLNHRVYEDAKNALNSLASVHGYFDAKMTEHKVSVYSGKKYADIRITLDSGCRYRFGDIQYVEMTARFKDILQSLVIIKQGDLYDAVMLGKVNHDIASTGYFHKIEVHPVKSDITNNEVPIAIHAMPRLRHEIKLGAGYATDEGPRASLHWDKHLVNSYGHSLSNVAHISKKKTSIASSYKIPDGNPLQKYYNLHLGYEQKIAEDTDSKLISAAIHRWNKRSFRNNEFWDYDIFFRVEQEDYTQGKQNGSTLLLIPGVSFMYHRLQGDSFNYHGNQQLVKFELSNKAWRSDVDFIKIWGRTQWLHTYFSKHRMIVRAEQGAILMIDHASEVPPSLRFFTGGDQSIRGFDYESISPKDKNGYLTGARYVTTASVEYAYSFLGKWWIATFIDSGTATNDYKDEWKVGAGVGIRWISFLGQIKLDIACAISEEDKPWRFHLTMGPML